MRIPPLRRRITEKDVEEIFRVVGRFREVEYRKEVGEMLRDAEPPRKISEMVRR